LRYGAALSGLAMSGLEFSVAPWNCVYFVTVLISKSNRPMKFDLDNDDQTDDVVTNYEITVFFFRI